MREIRRGRTAASRVPMIALTADAMREHHASYREAGAGAVVTKPVDWHRLNDETDRLTGGSADPVVADAPARATPELPVLDGAMLESLSASIGGKLFNTLLDTCADNIGAYTAAIVAGADDLKEAKRTAHALKGLCAQFGALSLCELARPIEEGAKENREVGALAPLVAAAADDTLEAFAGWREQPRLSA